MNTNITGDLYQKNITRRGNDRLLGALLIVDALLSFAPVVILGAAIGWPASLGKPAADQLAAIHANASMVALGYGAYLVYSILVAPVMIGLARRAFGNNGGALSTTVAVFAGLSALARSIGILRWLTVMPALASLHFAADAASRAQIELVFKATTLYGGGIGEILGVSIFMALSLGTLTVGALLRGGLPAWLSWLGVISAAMLVALSIPTFGGPNIMPVAAAVTVLTIWMIAAGAWCFRANNV